MNTVQKIETVRKYKQICNHLRRRILFGEILPGGRLPTVQELSQEFGVSQATVREALRVLESEGLIDTRHGAGIFVVQRDLSRTPIGQYLEWLTQNDQKLGQVLQVREYMEGLAAGLCAAVASDDNIAELRENLVAQESLVKLLNCPAGPANRDPIELGEELDRLAYRFHLIISQASGNEFAYEILKQVLSFIFENSAPYLYANRHPCESFEEHQEIFKHIQAHNSSQAEKAMRKHIRRDRQLLK